MGKTTKESLVILDNTVLTNFGLVGRPDLIHELWQGAACTSRAVLAEFLAGVGAANLQADAWTGLPVLDLTPSEEAFSLSLSHRLGVGERTCLAVAVTRRVALATDNFLVRQYARRAGLTG